MRFYETTIVLDPQSEDAVIEREIEKVTDTIVRAQGQLVATQRWGVKRMAYPIQKHPQAHYVHFVYQAPSGVPGELESTFRINESILRHLTVLVEGPLPTRPSAETSGREQAAAPAPATEPATKPAAEPAAKPSDEEKAPVAVAETPKSTS